ncbi:MAG TPA: PEP-CTERM sorting domain-containing protein [Albitalea sp.]|nr:PEP-CTERM sorting domain-containing protein [Albitalea sp.]
MFKQIALAALVAAAVSPALATTAVGGATLVDNATVHNGTVSTSSFLTYVSGGNGAVGFATGTTWGGVAGTPASAMSGADHIWLQYDPAILVTSGNNFLSKVLAIPAIDHGWTADNTGEFYEPFEFRIWGCTGASTTSCVEEGKISDVYTRGVDDSSASKNADDFASVWRFEGSYNYFAIMSGDRLVGGGTPGYSPGEGEIDALAVVGAVPEPSTYALLAGGLGLVGFVARRRRPS